MLIGHRGRYGARIAGRAGEVEAAQRLRWRAFRGPAGTGGEAGLDRDRFDALCRHVLIQEVAGGRLVATCRLLPLDSGAEIGRSYAAQFYGLEGLAGYRAPLVEMGRFCVEPGVSDPDILRVAWSAVTAFVDREGAGLIFGCASFRGVDAAAYGDAFAWLRDRHLAPGRWRPRVAAPEVVRFARFGRADPAVARKTLPPLLRSYLAMGGRVSDHAVVDRELNTLHVFTGLEVGQVPAARARVLRAAAG